MVIKTGNARTWLFRLFKTESSWKQWHCLAINGPFSSHGVVTRLNFRWQILQCVAFKNWFTLINDSGKPVIIMPICPRSIMKLGFYKISMFSLQHKIIKLVYANALVCVMTTVAVGKQDCLHTTLSLSDARQSSWPWDKQKLEKAPPLHVLAMLINHSLIIVHACRHSIPSLHYEAFITSKIRQ